MPVYAGVGPARSLPAVDDLAAESRFWDQVNGMDITTDNIVSVLGFAMQVVECTSLRGVEKRAAANALVREAIVHAIVDDDTEKFLLGLVDSGVLGSVSDLVVSASRGQLNLDAATTFGSAVARHLPTCIFAKCLRK